MQLRTRDRILEMSHPWIMGIVNINDDSFSGDGSLEVSRCLELAATMLQEGADIIDVGAESARTNRQAIEPEEEIQRLKPFMERFQSMIPSLDGPFLEDQLWPPLLSVNTWRSEVIEGSLEMGAELINDISGLPDGTNARLCAEAGVALLVMHSVGEPKVPHLTQLYDDVMETMEAFFESRLQICDEAGLSQDQVILDPGIDFAKQRDDNLTVYRCLERLYRFGCPLLLPVSRKTVIGDVLNQPIPGERDAGTVACIVAGMKTGAQIFRVHHVHAAVQTTRVLGALNC